MFEKREYLSRISDLGENIRPQNVLNVYHLTAHAYWLVLKKAIHRVFSCKTVSPQDSSCYSSKQRRLGAKCNSLLTGNVTSEITKDNWEWGRVTLTLFGLVPSSTSVECMYQYCIGFLCFWLLQFNSGKSLSHKKFDVNSSLSGKNFKYWFLWPSSRNFS